MLSLVKNNQEEDQEQITNHLVTYPPPEFMGYEAKCEWIRCVGYLVEMGMFSGPNVGLFESYCIAMGASKEFEQMLAVDGMIVNGKPHAAYRMMLDSMKVAHGIWEGIKPKKIVIKDQEEKEENVWKDKGLLA